MHPVLAVGWDVGGWHGTKQAVAVALLEGDILRWQGRPALFSIANLHESGGSAVDLTRLAWPEAPDDVLDRYRVTIAIDSPLGFPEMFAQVLVSDDVPKVEASTFYENPLAFRECDRWVYRTFGKRPLSASFDKLGNNAVVAIIHARKWSQLQGFQIAPQHGQEPGDRTIIEVYPALVKRADTVDRRCYERFGRLLPTELEPGTDQYDAAICAVLAASYGVTQLDDTSDLPSLMLPPDSIPRSTLKDEGWIYAVPPEWLRSPF
jgi:hypothetical protein